MNSFNVLRPPLSVADARSSCRRMSVSVLFLLFVYASQAQVLLTGRVTDARGGAIPYARIGIIDTRVAMISDIEGRFSLSIPAAYKSRKLTFQAPGYRTESFKIDSLMSQDKVHLILKENTRLLEAVTVKKKRYRPKNKTLGNKSLPPYAQASYGSHWTLVTLIEADQMSQVMNVKIHIGETRRDFVTLRPVLYAFDPVNHRPAKELTERNEFLKARVKKGWLDYDLSAQALYPEGAFFIGFEILSASEDEGDVAVSASLGGKNKHVMWERPSFTSAWRKASNTYMIKARIEY